MDAVTLQADAALVGEFARRKPPLRIGPVRLRARDVLVNPGRLAATGVVELLDVGALAVERLGVAEPGTLGTAGGWPPGPAANLPGRRGALRGVRLPPLLVD